jgi:hypothetical protein
VCADNFAFPSQVVNTILNLLWIRPHFDVSSAQTSKRWRFVLSHNVGLYFAAEVFFLSLALPRNVGLSHDPRSLLDSHPSFRKGKVVLVRMEVLVFCSNFHDLVQGVASVATVLHELRCLKLCFLNSTRFTGQWVMIVQVHRKADTVMQSKPLQ